LKESLPISFFGHPKTKKKLMTNRKIESIETLKLKKCTRKVIDRQREKALIKTCHKVKLMAKTLLKTLVYHHISSPLNPSIGIKRQLLFIDGAL
jgi:hypothetical protein